MRGTLVVLLAAISFAHAFDKDTPLQIFEKKDIALKINEYFDAILIKLKVYLKEKGYEPYHLEDVHIANFETKDLLGNSWRTRLGLYNGVLYGVTTMQRAGDATLRYNAIAGSFDLRADVIFTKLEVDYDFAAQVFNIGPRGKIKATVEDLSAEFETAIFPKNFTMELKDLRLNDAKDIRVEVRRMGFFQNSFSDSFINSFTTLFKKSILRIVEMKVREEAAKAIASINPGALPLI